MAREKCSYNGLQTSKAASHYASSIWRATVYPDRLHPREAKGRHTTLRVAW